MKMETLLTKSELQKLLITHILEEELMEIDSVVKEGEGITVSFEDLSISAGEVAEMVKNATDTTEPATKQNIVVTPEGGCGIETEQELA